MNERIRELWKDSAVRDDPNHTWTYDPDLHVEKFAELIIKECGVALSPMLRDMISRGKAVDLINKHFGVEE